MFTVPTPLQHRATSQHPECPDLLLARFKSLENKGACQSEAEAAGSLKGTVSGRRPVGQAARGRSGTCSVSECPHAEASPSPPRPALGVAFGGPSGTARFGNVTQHDLGKGNLTFISSGFRILTREAGCSKMESRPHEVSAEWNSSRVPLSRGQGPAASGSGRQPPVRVASPPRCAWQVEVRGQP